MLPQHSHGPGVAKTSLTIREVRAQILLGAVLRCPDLERIEDLVEHLPYFTAWGDQLGDIIGLLVADGLITEGSDGRLCVKRRAA